MGAVFLIGFLLLGTLIVVLLVPIFRSGSFSFLLLIFIGAFLLNAQFAIFFPLVLLFGLCIYKKRKPLFEEKSKLQIGSALAVLVAICLFLPFKIIYIATFNTGDLPLWFLGSEVYDVQISISTKQGDVKLLSKVGCHKSLGLDVTNFGVNEVNVGLPKVEFMPDGGVIILSYKFPCSEGKANFSDDGIVSQISYIPADRSRIEVQTKVDGLDPNTELADFMFISWSGISVSVSKSGSLLIDRVPQDHDVLFLEQLMLRTGSYVNSSALPAHIWQENDFIHSLIVNANSSGTSICNRFDRLSINRSQFKRLRDVVGDVLKDHQRTISKYGTKFKLEEKNSWMPIGSGANVKIRYVNLSNNKSSASMITLDAANSCQYRLLGADGSVFLIDKMENELILLNWKNLPKGKWENNERSQQ